MQIFELKIFIKLKKSVTFKQNPSFLSKNINKSFLNNEKLKASHKQNIITPYCMDFLRNLGERKDVFEVGDEAYFCIRSIFFVFIQCLMDALNKSDDLDFEIISINFSKFEPKFIRSLYTMTPAVVTINKPLNKNESSDEHMTKQLYWSRENSDLMSLKNALEFNLKNKYRTYVGELDFEGDIIDLIEVKTNKAFAFPYKKGQIYAYRYQIYFNENKIAQNLAALGLGLGVGEKGSLAFGFSKIGDER